MRTLVLGIVAVALATLFVRLGIWQLERYQERKATNARIERALEQPVLQLDSLRGAALGQAQSQEWSHRQAEGSGRYDHTREVVMKGRAWQGSPGVEIVTPLILDDGGQVWVNRGWVPSADAATVDLSAYQEPGRVRVSGYLRSSRRGEPGAQGGLILEQMPDSTLARYPMRRGRPELSASRHFTYALQWFAFAAIALMGYSAYVRMRRPRRASRSDMRVEP